MLSPLIGNTSNPISKAKSRVTQQTGTTLVPLAEGINRLRPLKSKSKILILLTDGKDEPAPIHSPLVYAVPKKIISKSIRLLLVQTLELEPIYITQMKGYYEIRQWPPVIDVAEYPVDKEVLCEIAERTEAKFLRQKTRLYERFMMKLIN